MSILLKSSLKKGHQGSLLSTRRRVPSLKTSRDLVGTPIGVGWMSSASKQQYKLISCWIIPDVLCIYMENVGHLFAETKANLIKCIASFSILLTMISPTSPLYETHVIPITHCLFFSVFLPSSYSDPITGWMYISLLYRLPAPYYPRILLNSKHFTQFEAWKLGVTLDSST